MQFKPMLFKGLLYIVNQQQMVTQNKCNYLQIKKRSSPQ